MGDLVKTKKEYCYECDDFVDIKIQEQTIENEIKGIYISYTGNVAYCKECGNEVYISTLNDENINKANKIYREKTNLIHISEIRSLFDKYNIGQKPLARLLGWGENTIVRYLQGLTPTKEYSERLKQLHNPYKMLELFEQNKGILTDVAKRKLEISIKENINSSNKGGNSLSALDTANYFLNKMDVEAGDCITPLKIQKMVFYAQSWFLAMFNEPLFPEDFQAWQHGPVVPELYFRYKPLGYASIPQVSILDQKILSDNQKSVMDMVWKVYGKYDGKYLEYLTHSEYPWRNAWDKRNQFNKGDVCIDKSIIREFYGSLKKELSINSTKDYIKLDQYVSNFCFTNGFM